MFPDVSYDDFQTVQQTLLRDIGIKTIAMPVTNHQNV